MVAKKEVAAVAAITARSPSGFEEAAAAVGGAAHGIVSCFSSDALAEDSAAHFSGWLIRVQMKVLQNLLTASRHLDTELAFSATC